jgi:hypothetical protein
MRVTAACAALVLAAFAAAGAHGSSRAGCPAPAAARPDLNAFELTADGARGYVSDTQGRVGIQVPGVNDELFRTDTPSNWIASLLIDAPHTNSYIVRMVAKDSFPLAFTLSRAKPTDFVKDDSASWFIARNLKGAHISIAFASGQRLDTVRLCVNGMPMAPTGTAKGAAAADQDPPKATSSAVPAGAGQVRVTLRARDARSGVAGIWYLVNRGGVSHANLYRAPVVVARGAPLIFWAVDNAGNSGSSDAQTR